eukprot:1142912-Pelagomonas_calceolata.AAC.9
MQKWAIETLASSLLLSCPQFGTVEQAQQPNYLAEGETPLGKLIWPVADAVLTWNEDHAGGRNPVQRLGTWQARGTLRCVCGCD